MRFPVIVLILAQSFHVFLAGKAKMTVRDSLREASVMVMKPSCAQLFDDFRDGMGAPLSRVLDAQRKTPGEWLSGLYFADGSPVRCRTDQAMVAYTAPGNRVIWICGDRFADQFALSVRRGAVLLIHECLHTLGLGENPPSSAAITAAVARRCR